MTEWFAWKDLPRQGRGGHVRDPWIAEQLEKLRSRLTVINFPNGKALAKAAGVSDNDWFKIVQRFPSTPTQVLAPLHYAVDGGIFDPREYPDIIMPNGEIRSRAWGDEQYYKGLDEYRARGLPVAPEIEAEQKERKIKERGKENSFYQRLFYEYILNRFGGVLVQTCALQSLLIESRVQEQFLAELYYERCPESRENTQPCSRNLTEETARQMERRRKEELKKIRELYKDFPRAIPLRYDSKEGYGIYDYKRLPRIPSNLWAEPSLVEDTERGVEELIEIIRNISPIRSNLKPLGTS